MEELDEADVWYRDYPVTGLLLASYVALFALMIWSQGTLRLFGVLTFLGIDPNILARYGALDPQLVAQGQYWRLLTATMLHASLVHLALNGFAVFQLGRVIEEWYGGGMLLALHVGLGVFGNLGTLWYHSNVPHYTQVGASGALYGLFGLLAVLAWHDREQRDARLAIKMTVWIIASMLLSAPLGADNAAHMAGAIGGVAVGLAERHLRVETQPRWLPITLLTSGSLALVLAFALQADWAQEQVAKQQRRYANEADQVLRIVFNTAATGPERLVAPRLRFALAARLTRARPRLTGPITQFVDQTVRLLGGSAEQFVAENRPAQIIELGQSYQAWRDGRGQRPWRDPDQVEW